MVEACNKITTTEEYTVSTFQLPLHRETTGLIVIRQSFINLYCFGCSMRLMVYAYVKQ